MTQLREIRNSNYKWVYFLGNPHVWDIKNDTWIISINDKRIYFNGELSFYGTSEIIEDLESSIITATQIINSHF